MGSKVWREKNVVAENPSGAAIKGAKINRKIKVKKYDVGIEHVEEPDEKSLNVVD